MSTIQEDFTGVSDQELQKRLEAADNKIKELKRWNKPKVNPYLAEKNGVEAEIEIRKMDSYSYDELLEKRERLVNIESWILCFFALDSVNREIRELYKRIREYEEKNGLEETKVKITPLFRKED